MSDKEVEYFPREPFVQKNIEGEPYFSIEYSWYSKQLKALQEPSLYRNSNTETEEYRFTYLRTFHNPIALRIRKSDDHLSIVIKICDGQGGYEPGTLDFDVEMPLSQQEWQEFQKFFHALDFWSRKSCIKVNALDGSMWLLEAKKQDQYHFVTRYAGGDPDFYDCCSFMIQLSSLLIPKSERY